MKRIATMIAAVLVTLGISAQTTLISYNSDNELPSGITLGGTTTEATVKIHANTDLVNAILLKNNYLTDEEYSGNDIVLSVKGGFKAGDTIKIAGVYNTSATKSVAAVLFTYDDETKQVNLLAKTADFFNSRSIPDDPKVISIVLRNDAETLHVGRSGSASAYITSLSVVRPPVEITTDYLENKYTDKITAKIIWGDWKTWTDKNTTETVQILKVDDTHITINNLLNMRYTMDATVDPVNRTITMDNTKGYSSNNYKICATPSTMTYGELYSDACDETKPAIGTIGDDGTITLSYCVSYYGGWVIGTSTEVLTPDEIPTKCEWTATCSSEWRTSEGATSAYVADNNGMTIKKITHGDDVTYQLSTLGGTYNGQNPSPVVFSINEDGTLEMTQSNMWVYNILTYGDIVYLEGYDGTTKESSFEGNEEAGKMTVAYWFYKGGYSSTESEKGTITITWPYKAAIKGDVNGDGVVNIADVNAIISVMCGGEMIAAADVNGDGEVNIADVNADIAIICGMTE